MAKKIVNEKSPRNHKALGRKIKNFDENKWIDNRETIVYKGVYLKFVYD